MTSESAADVRVDIQTEPMDVEYVHPHHCLFNVSPMVDIYWDMEVKEEMKEVMEQI